MENIKKILTKKNRGFYPKRIENLNDFEYLSASRIKTWMKSERSFYRQYFLGIKPEDTKAKAFGRLVHTALLEPEIFTKRVQIEKSFSGTGMRAAKKEWLQNLPIDVIVVTEKQSDQIKYMIESLQSHKLAMDILKDTNRELHAYSYDENLDQWFYGILDFIKSNAIGDLKTTQSCHPKSFGSDMIKYGYFIQAALYMDLANELQGKDVFEHFSFIAIESAEPYTTEIFTTPHHLIEAGRNLRIAITKEYQAKMKAYKNDKKIIWNGYSKNNDVLEPVIPQYALYDLEAMEVAHNG